MFSIHNSIDLKATTFIRIDDNVAYSFILKKVLLRASKAGSPTNRSGSDKPWGQGSFGPSTGGPDLHGSLTIDKLDNHLDKNF